MAITYKWLIHGFRTVAEENGQHNVIKRVIFELEATDGTHKSRAKHGPGWMDFEPTDPQNFVDYENFNEDMVSTWLDQNVPNIESLKTEARLKIEDRYLPPVSSQSTPWAYDPGASES